MGCGLQSHSGDASEIQCNTRATSFVMCEARRESQEKIQTRVEDSRGKR